jgi:tetratricopeptide (TPR) repeat protein
MPEQDPLCFVLMPFGKKKDPGGGPEIDFDSIYKEAIRPAIEAAGMEPIRADEELAGGIIHKPMFERLMLCDYAVADLTTANANVFYELGVRHAVRPATTVSIFATQQKLPFDVVYLRAIGYDLAEGNRLGATEAQGLREKLSKRLSDVREAARKGPIADSPVFQLIENYPHPDIAHLKTDVFRERAEYAAGIKRELAQARESHNVERTVAIEDGIKHPDQVEAGVFVDLLLTYRALSQWDRMIGLYGKMPVELQRVVMMREQLGFALNRANRRREALDVLEQVVKDQGASSETCGLIGRVYKDLWMEERASGSKFTARGYLDKAIDSYVRGFEADSRDAYPGVNTVTLLDIRGDAESLKRKDELVPVVRFAVVQRLKYTTPDYWDQATLLELAVLENDEEAASKHLGDALACVREKWEPKTTADNLTMIRDARQQRGTAAEWLGEVIESLLDKAK